MVRPVLLAIFVSALLWVHQGLAQDESIGLTPEQADAQLNAAYQACLKHFTGDYKEQLRVAQRAWIAFSNEQEAASELAGKNHDLAQEIMDAEALKEVRARTIQLRAFFALPNQDLEACRKALDEADADLTVAYKQSLDSLSAEEQNKLQQAERAWIEFRDKNARAHVGDPSGRAPVWASTVVTRRRAQGLREFYGRTVAGEAGSPAAPSPTPEPAATPADPAVLAKAIADLHGQVSGVYQKAVAQSELFKTYKAFAEVKPVPPELATEIGAAADAARDFRRQVGYEIALRDCATDTAIVDALVAFESATRDIAAGNAPRASDSLQSFRKEHAASPDDAHKPLWSWLDSIMTLCAEMEADAKVHLERAESLASAAKTGDAVREYQEAYRIYPDPAVAEKIKKLRDESLGL